MKKKLLASAAVGAAGLVALTGAAFARTDDVDTSETIKDRVAEILGISSDQLDEAFQQARAEDRAEKLAERLAEAVEEGVITQEEADTVTAWFEARPGFVDELDGKGRFGLGLRFAGDSERYEAMLTRLLEDGTITEDEAQAFRDWMASAPTDILELVRPDDEGGHGIRGRIRGHGPNGGLFEGRFELRPYSPSADDDGGSEPSDASATSEASA
jgi:polyhydroxyalkanoate synthesis regulator phasin